MTLKFFMSAIIVLSFVSVTHAVNISDTTYETVENAKMQIADMQGLGLPINRANDTLREALRSYNEKDYSHSLALPSYVGKIKELAESCYSLIDYAENRISTAEAQDLNVSAAKQKFSEALSLYSEELFEESIKKLDESINIADAIEKEASIHKALASDNIFSSMTKQWHFVTLSSGVVLFFSLFIFKKTKPWRIKRVIYSLEKEKHVMKKSAAAVQEKYYAERSVSKSSYNIAIKHYRNHTAGISEKIAQLKNSVRKHHVYTYVN